MCMETAPIGDKLLPSAGKLEILDRHPASVTSTLTRRAALRQNHINRTSQASPLKEHQT